MDDEADKFVDGTTKELPPPTLGAMLATEFIGTFFLVLTVGASETRGPTILAPLSVGSVLMVLVYSGGHISGGHYNPAVTLAVLLSGRNMITLKKALMYMAVQMVGGFLGAVIAYGLIQKSFPIGPVGNIHVASAFFAELLYTFLLGTAVLQTATTQAQANNSFFGLAIGFAVLTEAFTIGEISGGAVNPAVGVGLLIVHGFAGGDAQFIWLFLLAPLMGGALSALVFRFTSAREYVK